MEPLGRYTPIAKLGSGGMADVFLAVSKGAVERLVVVKRPRGELGGDSRFSRMFLDEAKLAVRLTHPNVVHTYDASFENGMPIIAMEYLEGQTLRKVLARVRRGATAGIVPRAVWFRIVSDVLAGLHYAHELRDLDGTALGIVHRDVSPENIFVTYDGVSKLVDFGIAKAHLNSDKSEPGTLKGKYRYLAPEYVKSHKTDLRCDIFAMGIVTWEVLTGKQLFDGDQAQILMQILQAEIQKPSAFTPEVPPELDAIVMRALERDPATRYQTADDMRSALDEYAATHGERADHADVAKAMAKLFRGQREKMQERVKLCVSGLRAAAARDQLPSVVDVIEALPTLAGGTPVRTSTPAGGAVVTAPHSSVAAIAAQKVKANPRAVYGGAAGVVALLAVLVLARAFSAPKKDATAPAAAQPPPAAAAAVPPPAGVAPQRPPEPSTELASTPITTAHAIERTPPPNAPRPPPHGARHGTAASKPLADATPTPAPPASPAATPDPAPPAPPPPAPPGTTAAPAPSNPRVKLLDDSKGRVPRID